MNVEFLSETRFVMKAIIPVFALALFFSSCSTCYECYELVPQIDANTGDTLDYVRNSDSFCTADAAEVDDRESEGAICEIQ